MGIEKIALVGQRVRLRPLPHAHVLWVLLSAFGGHACHAQVYKWVDHKGQVHYSERKGDAGASPTAEVKITPSPKPPPQAKPLADDFRAPGELTMPPPTATNNTGQPPAAKGPRAQSDGRDHGTDASRCALARDVLSGAVRHRNGKPTDQYDRDVASSDIKLFCRGS